MNHYNRYKKRTDGFRSQFEANVAAHLTKAGVDFTYESLTINYTKPVKKVSYRPDFILANGIIVETKGLFSSADRIKHLLVKEQHPNLDIRFVFMNANNKLRKGSKTSYGDWATKNGFRWASGGIPKSWLLTAKAAVK